MRGIAQQGGPAEAALAAPLTFNDGHIEFMIDEFFLLRLAFVSVTGILIFRPWRYLDSYYSIAVFIVGIVISSFAGDYIADHIYYADPAKKYRAGLLFSGIIFFPFLILAFRIDGRRNR